LTARDLRRKEMFVAKQRLTSSSKNSEREEEIQRHFCNAVGNYVAELFVARYAICASTRQSAKFTFDYVVCLKFIDVSDIISIWIGLITTDLP